MDTPASLRELGAVLEGGRVAHFGDPVHEAGRVTSGSGAWLAPLLDTTPLRVTGGDRASFLHGQLSNVVEGLPAGACNATLQLDPRGRVVGEAVLVVREDDLYLAVEDGRGPEVRASLERHIVFDDVIVTDLTGTLAAVTLQGAAAADVLDAALGLRPGPGAAVQAAFGDATVLAVERRRSVEGGFDLHLLARDIGALVASLTASGADLVGARARTLARVRAGIVSAAYDAPEGALPQELGLEHAVSGAKGCYLGQEIMARIEARGSVKRGAARVRLAGDDAGRPADAGEALWLDGREVGTLGTVVRAPTGEDLALAVVRRDLPDGAILTVGDWSARLLPAAPGQT